MTLPTPSAARTRDLVSRFAGLRVLVVGDVMLDRFLVGTVTRISPEAPVPVVRYRSEHVRLGGAANVAHNLRALGATVSLVGVVGRDAGAERLREALAEARIAADGLVTDPSRRTVEKVRVVTERNQQVARIDYEEDADLTGSVEQALVARLRGAGAHALLVSDYLKGVVTRSVVQALAEQTRAAPLVVDPKVQHFDRYAGATIVTPNHHEAEQATGQPIRCDADAASAALALRSMTRSDAVLITRGEHGMWLSSHDLEGAVAASAREVADVTGAGDTVVAVLALALAAGGTLAEAAVIANQAAGIVVGKFGPATVTAEELVATV
jgi:D-beta-D-heptose 7-phosphate kinase/D-beta-D-heptose 1-phosphate adenosyltransferase